MGSRDAATENDRATVSRTKGQPQQTMVRACRTGPSGQRLNPSRTKHFGSAKRERLTPDRSLDGIVHKGRDHPREQRAPRPRREPLPREIRGRIPIDILALALRERGIGRPDLHDSPAPESERRQRSRFRNRLLVSNLPFAQLFNNQNTCVVSESEILWQAAVYRFVRTRRRRRGRRGRRSRCSAPPSRSGPRQSTCPEPTTLL